MVGHANCLHAMNALEAKLNKQVTLVGGYNKFNSRINNTLTTSTSTTSTSTTSTSTTPSSPAVPSCVVLFHHGVSAHRVLEGHTEQHGRVVKCFEALTAARLQRLVRSFTSQYYLLTSMCTRLIYKQLLQTTVTNKTVTNNCYCYKQLLQTTVTNSCYKQLLIRLFLFFLFFLGCDPKHSQPFCGKADADQFVRPADVLAPGRSENLAAAFRGRLTFGAQWCVFGTNY